MANLFSRCREAAAPLPRMSQNQIKATDSRYNYQYTPNIELDCGHITNEMDDLWMMLMSLCHKINWKQEFKSSTLLLPLVMMSFPVL